MHVVVTAADRDIQIPREQFKSWCTRKLKKHAARDLPPRENWWTDRGWDIYIDHEDHLFEVIAYVLYEQDR